MNKTDLETVLDSVRPLISEIRFYSNNYVGKVFIETEWEFIDLIRANDDGGDTDLYSCIVSENSKDRWIKFYVDVNPKTREIVSISLKSVDIGYDGEIFDCVDISSIVTVEKGNFKMTENTFKNDSYLLLQRLNENTSVSLGVTKEELYDLYFVVSDFMLKNC